MGTTKTEIKRLKNAQTCKVRLQSISDALYAIGGKWRLQIIVALLDGKSRFNDLRRTIEGISSKILASELKVLELNGLVKREVIAGPPVVVNYNLTDYSHSLQGLLDVLSQWGMSHREKVKKLMREEANT